MLALTTKNRRAVWQIAALALVALGVVGGMVWRIDRELRDELLRNSLTVAQTVDAEQLEALALAAGDRARREFSFQAGLGGSDGRRPAQVAAARAGVGTGGQGECRIVRNLYCMPGAERW